MTKKAPGKSNRHLESRHGYASVEPRLPGLGRCRLSADDEPQERE